jgi:hypothetical protein
MLQSFVVRNNYVYCSNLAFGGDLEQAGHKLFVRYNLQTGEYEEYGPAYPDFPLGDANASSLPFYAFGHDHNIVIRLGSQPDLYIYNMKYEYRQHNGRPDEEPARRSTHSCRSRGQRRRPPRLRNTDTG